MTIRTTTYHCNSFQSVKLGEHVGIGDLKWKVRSVDDAAKAFGYRLARRRYGNRAYVWHVKEDYHDKKCFHFDAWIGKPDGTGMKGRSVRLSITYEIKLKWS